MNAMKEKDHESVQVQMPLLFTFMHNNDCVQLVPQSMVTKQFNLG